MILVPVAPPDPIVSATDAKARVPALAAVDNAVIDALVMAMTQALDGPDGYLQRALGVQTWDFKIDAGLHCQGGSWNTPFIVGNGRYWSNVIDLPLPPLVSVDSVKYLDAAGTLQTWASGNYVVSGVGGKGHLMPASGVSWPAFGAFPESLIIRFTAGYETVPAPIVQAILLSLGYAGSLTATTSADSGAGIKRKSVLNGLIDVTYMTPAELGSSSSGTAVNMAAASLLAPYRVFA